MCASALKCPKSGHGNKDDIMTVKTDDTNKTNSPYSLETDDQK